MDAPQAIGEGQDGSRADSPSSGGFDPRLTPTPDYGTLGPDSDFARLNSPHASTSPQPPSRGPARNANNARLLSVVAALAGMVAALVAGSVGKRSPRERSTDSFSARNAAGAPRRAAAANLDQQRAQKQAETLLEQAVQHSAAATDEIQSQVDQWRGKLQLTPHLTQLTTAALNSNDDSLRSSAIEVQLAAYGLSKNDAALANVLRQVDSADHAQKIWAMWSLGLLANRGVQRDRVVEVLAAHLAGSARDANVDSRRWAVESLALVGSDATIAPLLRAMHDDVSPLVRERAACSLASSGMLTHEQRMTVVPKLIEYSDDPALDAQTHGWAFLALHDITQQALPNDSASWRNWYESTIAGR